MIRTSFIAFLSGALAAAGLKFPARFTRVSGKPSISKLLPPGVIVKWEDWREWIDPATKAPMASWAIRFTTVPSRYANIKFDPHRAFLQAPVELDENGNEKVTEIYSFVTYGEMVEGKENIEALKNAVNTGTVYPDFVGTIKNLGMRMMPNGSIARDERPFLDYLKRSVACCDDSETMGYKAALEKHFGIT